MKENKAQAIIENVARVIIGKRDTIELAVICLIAGGHLLLEDVPGVGKTTLAKTLAGSLGLKFGRIQFTPDTLPSDVTGVSVYQMQSGTFRYVPGVVMNQIVLADEINRAAPKTQASLLEAMGEGQVSVDGKTYPLPETFMVIATENPIEQLGTYPLPEAQLDRFFMKISLGYPAREQEEAIIKKYLFDEHWGEVEAVATADEVLKMRKQAARVQIHNDLIHFLMDLVEATRKNENLMLGVSPRALLALIRASQASAYVEGRNYVIPDDVVKILYPLLCHRMFLTPEARMNRLTPERILTQIRSEIVLPVLP